MSTSTAWKVISESKYPWERDALDFIRLQFPDVEPCRAWSNFEFIAGDGSINEVDLLVFTSMGLFLIEIKSRPGRLFGDAGTWTWDSGGRLHSVDNPLYLANAKARKLKTLLQQQSAFKGKVAPPFIEALVFCSAADLSFDLHGVAAYRICLRDRPADADRVERPGIIAAILERRCAGLEAEPRVAHDRPLAKALTQAMEQAGIRPKPRKVSDFLLQRMIGEGPGFQDWMARHVQVESSLRRIRLYQVGAGITREDRRTIGRAALREFQILESLQHPGILRTLGYSEHEIGPAVIYEHDPLAIRLDHYLTQNQTRLSVDARLDLVRQIAEVVRFAHEKRVVHRALCPQSILITDATATRPRIKIFNWQVGYRLGTTTSVSREIAPTSHVERLVEDVSTAYLAPEALIREESTGDHLDVFSLGALAYHIFSGQPPAQNAMDLSQRLRSGNGLKISDAMNGAGERLQFLIQFSTNPNVTDRMDSAVDFLQELDTVEEELTTPEHDSPDDPAQAQGGHTLPGGYNVLKRLGAGASSTAFLVEREGQEYILKIANSEENNSRLQGEGEVLGKLRHAHIVEFCHVVEISDRTGVLLRPVFADRTDKKIETLGQRVRRDGSLHVDMLQRFGEDLLDVVRFLEEQGIPHRDIKPDNIAVGQVGSGHHLHLVLFDFSLSRASGENIRAGTTGYLDPLLPLRHSVRWDLHAERYAAAVTLYELATTKLPVWGDGHSDPSHLICEITLESELFAAALRDRLVAFFTRAFRRNPEERFPNAEEMLRVWRLCFEGIEEPGALSDQDDDTELAELLKDATWETHLAELGLGTRATNALDKVNILTVEDLLSAPMRKLLRLRGVGNKTRREIGNVVRLLRTRLGTPTVVESAESEESTEQGEVPAPNISVDLLAQRIRKSRGAEAANFRAICEGLLGLNTDILDDWPSQADVARQLDVSRARVGQILGKLVLRWERDTALTRLRADLAGLIHAAGGVLSVRELAEAVLVARGCGLDEPEARTRLAIAVVRAAGEVERTLSSPKFVQRRDGQRLLIALTDDLANYALRLGDTADKIALEDPLLPPGRVLERLREVQLPVGTEVLPDTRLLRLAATSSRTAAVSSRQELYPRGMDAVRALKLAQGAVMGVTLTAEEVRERVASRYPEAAPLPERTALDVLLREALGVEWNPDIKGGRYVSHAPDSVGVTSGTQSRQPSKTAIGPGLPLAEITPEVAESRNLDERLQRAAQNGAFLTLLVNMRYYEEAHKQIAKRYPVVVKDVEALFLDALEAVAKQARVDWELVVRTDATPGQPGWEKLLLLVGRAIPLVEAQLTADQTQLLIFPGLLARYDQMSLLERLRDRVGKRDGLPGVWVLLPGQNAAFIDGKAVPLISPGQRVTLTDHWVLNRHRGNGQDS